MSEKQSTYDDVKTLFETTFPDKKVVAVLDYSEESIIVVVEIPEAERHSYSGMYKINRHTGEAVVFVPTEDIRRFNDTLQNRSKFY